MVSKIKLTLLSVVVIVVFFNLPFYKTWVKTRLFSEENNIATQFSQMSREERMINRFGNSYKVLKDLTANFHRLQTAEPVLLLPPQGFVNDKKVENLLIPEPAIFYYFTGYKAVWYDSPDVYRATLALEFASDDRIFLKRIKSPQELNQLLLQYRQYKLDL